MNHQNVIGAVDDFGSDFGTDFYWELFW
jgi:hypothetical protein